MWNNFEEDKTYLENKYLNPTYDSSTGLDREQLLEGLEDIYQSTLGMPHALIKAKAFSYVLDNVRIDVNPHDWFVAIDCWGEHRERLLHKAIITKWQEEVYQKYAPEERKRMKTHNACGSLAIWPDYDHSIPDWNAVIELGFPGLLERARQYKKMHQERGEMTAEKEVYFEAIEIEYSAVLRFIERLYKKAAEKAVEHPRCSMVAKSLETLMRGGATNSLEMLQLDYIYFFISEYIDGLQVRSFGNLDQMLYPFYKKDLEDGTFNEAQIRELVSYFLQQAQVMHHYWGHPMYLGGTDKDGNTLVNKVSYLILEEFDRMGLYDPKIQIKWDNNTPAKFTEYALNMIRHGHNSIVFVCMPNIIDAMMSNGITETEARECAISGCYEVAVSGNYVSTASCHLNMLKGVELVLHNGEDYATGNLLGCRTGSLDRLTTFDLFYEAYLAQINSVLEEGIRIVNSFESHYLELNPTPLFSATIQESLNRGYDAYAGGSKYNFTSILVCGVASAVNALVAVKELVYDTEEYTLEKLKEIMDSDWEGYEFLRLRMNSNREKAGNHQPLSDRYTKAIASFVAQKINQRPNMHNGRYMTSLHCAKQFVEMGKRMAATPDGRKQGEEFSKNISPAMGTNWAGATAMVESITELDSSLFMGDFPVDIMLHPTAVQGPEGMAVLKQLLKTYCARGGLSIHFNVMDVSVLRDAQKHPEKYEDLQVRVCGWNVLWNNLPLSEQEKYIAQALAIPQ